MNSFSDISSTIELQSGEATLGIGLRVVSAENWSGEVEGADAGVGRCRRSFLPSIFGFSCREIAVRQGLDLRVRSAGTKHFSILPITRPT